MRRLRFYAVAVAASFAAMASLGAQEMGDPRQGLKFAQEACAACHAVERRQPSPNPQAPAFEAIANTRGMTRMALYAFLQTSHPTMPNLILEADEKAHVVAYILSLKVGQ